MNRTNRLVSSLFAAICVLATAACTSSAGSSTTSIAPITKAAYIEQANAICRKISTPMREAMNKVNADDHDAVDEAVLKTLLPAERKQLARIRALGFPAGDEGVLNAVYQAAEKEFDRIEKDPQRALGAGSTEFQDQAKVLIDYGVTECAGG